MEVFDTQCHTGFLGDEQNDSRKTDPEFDLGSRDLIGDGLTPPDGDISSDDEG